MDMSMTPEKPSKETPKLLSGSNSEISTFIHCNSFMTQIILNRLVAKNAAKKFVSIISPPNSGQIDCIKNALDYS